MAGKSKLSTALQLEQLKLNKITNGTDNVGKPQNVTPKELSPKERNTMSRKFIGTQYNTATADLTFTGANTHTGSETFTGSVSMSGGSVVPVTQSALVGATVVLTAANAGGVFINRSTSGSPSWTLPAATTAGLRFTFITANTTAGFTVTGAQVIHAKTSATGTAITTTTTLTNTQGTAVVGDTVTIVSDGAVWWMTHQSGIFAAS